MSCINCLNIIDADGVGVTDTTYRNIYGYNVAGTPIAVRANDDAILEGVVCLDCASPDADLDIGWWLEADSDSNGDPDATQVLHLLSETYLGLQGNALLFTGTCGASECLVYDIDASGTISSADCCFVDAGQDADCDGTAD